MSTTRISREEKSQQTRNAILTAAKKLFVKKGFAATAMSEVAKSAGVTKSLIHHHFGSKESLWDAIKKEKMDKLENFFKDEVFPHAGEFNRPRFEELMRNYFLFCKDGTEMIRMFSWLISEDRISFSEELCFVQTGIDMLALAQKGGLFRRDIDPRIIMIVFWLLLEQWNMLKKAYSCRIGQNLDTPAFEKDYLESAIKIFFDGIGPAKA